MGTRSWIIAQVKPDEAVQIICHRDSFPWDLGRRLQSRYNTDARVRNLLRHGDAVDIGDTARKSTFFHRDMGHPMRKGKYPDVTTAILDFSPGLNFDIEYVYVYGARHGHTGEWSFMAVNPDGLTEPAPVTEETIEADRQRHQNPDPAEMAARHEAWMEAIRRSLSQS